MVPRTRSLPAGDCSRIFSTGGLGKTWLGPGRICAYRASSLGQRVGRLPVANTGPNCCCSIYQMNEQGRMAFEYIVKSNALIHYFRYAPALALSFS